MNVKATFYIKLWLTYLVVGKHQAYGQDNEKFHEYLRGGTFEETVIVGAAARKLGLDSCADDLPNLDAASCFDVSCTSKDLEIVGAYLEVQGGCLDCNCGDYIENARLKLRIRNKTGSLRTAFGYTASLVETFKCSALSGETALTEQCVDERCNDDEGIPNTTDDAPPDYKELDFGIVPYTCGSELVLSDVLQYWTDASANSDCASFGRCKDLSPKCGRPGTDIVINPPLFALATSECITGTTQVVVTVEASGGQEPYTYHWSDGVVTSEPSRTLDDGAYTITVTDSGEKGCSFQTSVSEQICCSFHATCVEQTSANNYEGCSASVLPSPAEGEDAIAKYFRDVTENPCGTLTVTYSEQGSDGDVCPDGLTVTRSYTLTDEGNPNPDNSLTCDETFTVEKTFAPVLEFDGPLDQSIECATGCAENGAAGCFETPSATDGCGNELVPTGSGVSRAQVTCTEASGAGVYQQTWSAEDACGNKAEDVTQTITITDTTKPALALDGAALPGNMFPSCAEGIPEADVLTATDSCGPDPSVDFECCFNEGVIDRVWLATDECGNSASHQQYITFTCVPGSA